MGVGCITFPGFLVGQYAFLITKFRILYVYAFSTVNYCSKLCPNFITTDKTGHHDCGMGTPANGTSNIVGSIIRFFGDQSYVDPVMILLISERLRQLRSPKVAVKRLLKL